MLMVFQSRSEKFKSHDCAKYLKSNLMYMYDCAVFDVSDEFFYSHIISISFSDINCNLV